MDKEVLKNEQEHLSHVYKRLLVMKEELEKQIRDLNEKAVDDKNDIRDNIRFDYADAETTMETLAEIEVWNRYIDTYNVESSSLTGRLSTVNKLLESPYFAKIRVQFDPLEEPEDYYIGRVAVSENGYDQMVVDWRSPIAEVYYNQESGHTSYSVDDRQIAVDLILRRQFDLDRDVLKAYFDTQVAIEDPLLLESLSQTRSDKMQAITATIQKEQNSVIRYPDVSVLLVNGIAGSGKTSVLLQRIAYLFFRKRKSLRPDQLCLMTLNPIFRDYIDNVLPDLGETNPLTMTWQEYLEMLEVPFAGDGYDYTSAEDLMKITRKLPSLVPEADDFYDIRQKDKRVLSRNEVLSVIRKFDRFPMGVRLIQTAADELEQRVKGRLRDMEDERGGSEGMAGSEEARENRLENDYGGALSQTRGYGFVNAAHIAQRILGRKQISAAELLYTRMELTGLCDRNMRYVMVDEVQDYTRAQLMIFKKYYPSAKFMLLGDEYQAIRPGLVTFGEIREMAEADDKEYAELPLMTSYRSSPEITDAFASLLPKDKQLLVSSVQRSGDQVSIETAPDEDSYKKAVTGLLDKYSGSDGLTAIICRNRHNLEQFIALLGDAAPPLITGYDTLPSKGVFLMELSHAKGLEFDHVILPDADPESYPGDELGRHCLYTAMSRATRQLSILAKGCLTTTLVH
ncbi:HelD family protein [Butyrivibrio sp. MC2013]|uniref:HelD family protein n=1 Tax=Butyrivibrio sp. MC2013 TaxID=1280686 RepID=UPI000400D71A|nr:UvrD-helicase domain-containing protein [Butyrivibrio sp. MC2013]